METVHIWRSKSLQGLGWVTLAGIFGGIGLGAIAFPNLDIWLCHHFGCHFAGNFLWFVLTDVAMYCCYKYYMARIDLRIAQKQLFPEFSEEAYYVPLATFS